MSTQSQITSADLVKAASPLAIENSLRSVAKRMRRWNQWLTKNHRYNNDVVQTLASDVDQNTIDGPKLGEYIASSAPLHLADGWNYLSRAFDASTHGDRGSTCHLAYYAELRAAMSFLAAEGIGIFNNRHIALDANFQTTVYRGTTHPAAWQALSSWSQESGKAEGLLHSICVETKTLSDYLQLIGVGTPARQFVATEWLNAWSIDLKVYDDDRGRRNETSYRPTRIRVPASQPIDPFQELSNPLFNSWSELDPEVVGGSAALDLALLRNALNLVVDHGICRYGSFDDALAFLRQGEHVTRTTAEALRTERPSASAIFTAARIEDLQGKPATPILARALLMLRLASARISKLLSAAGVSRTDLKFWWLPLGTDMGLWHEQDDEDFLELWTDVGDAKDRAEDLISALPVGSSVRAVSEILSRDLNITQFSRAPLWLLDLD